jgi:hypothetical protein
MTLKKVFPLSAVVLLLLVATSCKKDCECPAPTPDPLDSGLVAFYTFTGNIIKDSTSNHNDGQNFGAMLTEDKFGHANSACYFNGTSNYIKVANSTSLDLKDNYSISAWIRPEVIVNEFQTIVWRGDHLPGFDPYALYINQSTFSSRRDGGTASSIINEITKPIDQFYLNRWSNVVATFNAGTKTMKLYVNGELAAQNTFTNTAIGYSTANDWNVIGSIEGLYGFFKGKMDEIRIYKRELSLEEAVKLYVRY